VSSLQIVERALGIPVKRFERPMFGYLSREEMLAVIDAPDETWIGQRDHVLFLMLYNTGARVSEITGVKVGDVVLDDACRLRSSAWQGPQAAQRSAVALDRQGRPGLAEAESSARGSDHPCCPTATGRR
jgi:integrase